MPVEAEGYACMTDNLLKVLLGVAATRARLNRCDVRTGDASALRAAIAMLAKRGDGRSHPPSYRLPRARPELRVAEHLRAHMLVVYSREGHCISGMEGKLGCVR
jgi:hypothetical protein